MAYSEETVKNVLDLHSKGYSSRDIAGILNIGSKSTVNNIINKTNNRTSLRLPDNPVKLCYLDVENLPAEALVFGRFNINLTQDHILKNGGELVSVCWMFEGEDTVSRVCMTPEEALNRDDSRICAILHDLMQDIDIGIGQNADRFDWPLIRTRFIKNGYRPTKTIKTIDTLKIAKQLKFPSNRLDSLADFLGVGRKTAHSGIKLWKDCLTGDKAALDHMVEYNANDVELLRDVYMALRAYDIKHPNLAWYYNDNEVRCNVCASMDLTATDNFVYTGVSKFREYHCNNCGHKTRSRVNEFTKEKRQSLMLNSR